MVKKSTLIIGVLALAGALMGNGPVSAAQPNSVLIGDLNPARDVAAVTIALDCAALNPPVVGQSNIATVSVKIFQSVGRLLNIGTGSSGVITCGAGAEDPTIDVNAIKGLKFQPGPATILVTQTIQTVQAGLLPTDPVTVVAIILDDEYGARIDLRP